MPSIAGGAGQILRGHDVVMVFHTEFCRPAALAFARRDACEATVNATSANWYMSFFVLAALQPRSFANGYLPISGDQFVPAFGADTIRAIAAATRLAPHDLAQRLAHLLYQTTIDTHTPEGVVTQCEPESATRD
jgi:hypothetical protein